jgi:hypothetical protein
MAGTRGAFGSIAGGRDALKKRGRALVVILGAFLAGCAVSEPPTPTVAAAPQPVVAAIPVPPPAPPPLDPPTATPEHYEGMRGPELVRLLGSPDFRRRDANAEVWQYRAGACVLDLFLYEEGGAFRVVYAETRSRATGRACNEEHAAAQL